MSERELFIMNRYFDKQLFYSRHDVVVISHQHLYSWPQSHCAFASVMHPWAVHAHLSPSCLFESACYDKEQRPALGVQYLCMHEIWTLDGLLCMPKVILQTISYCTDFCTAYQIPCISCIIISMSTASLAPPVTSRLPMTP